MQYWLVKTEPDTYSWDKLVAEKECTWDGIRNFQARNNLQLMKAGDKVLFYHTGTERAVTGIATITAAAFPEPGAPDWFAVRIAPVRKLKSPVSLTVIKSDHSLSSMSLVKLGRLSVHPVTKVEFDRIIQLSQ